MENLQKNYCIICFDKVSYFVSNYFVNYSGENVQKNYCIISCDSVSYFVFVMIDHALKRIDPVVLRAARYR